jgi:GT2 family glycosyltransferase
VVAAGPDAGLTVSRPRVLLAITVYNGRAFVPDCLASAARLVAASTEADVTVCALDDASPEPGWSAECERLCADLGLEYYRSPRNLGIVRNVNLGLLRAESDSFDYCIVSNSDVLYPESLVDQLIRVARSDPTIGSVTSWSNNVSVYSVPNDDPVRLRDQQVVDAVSAALAGEFGDTAFDVPTGISFAMLISTDAIRAVGLMDPVFGRGYCEETDWSVRSLRAGYRLTLAPGAFVYHSGGGSTVAAGLVAAGSTTVPANEAVIDWRYPDFRRSVGEFLESRVLEAAWPRAVSAVVTDAARRLGYRVEVSALPRPADDSAVLCVLTPGGGGTSVTATWRGFRATLAIDPADPAGSLGEAFGGEPLRVTRHAPDPVGDAMVATFTKAGVEVVDDYRYPERV